MTTLFKLPHDPLTPMDPTSRPTARTVRILRKQLFANLGSVTSELGGGGHGHLGMLMPPAAYQAISNGGVPYVPPVPPAQPIYHGTAALVATLQQQHTDRKKVFEDYRDLSIETKTMMIQAIPLSFIRTLNHDQVGFANATPLLIMNHLLQTYGEITEDDLETSIKELKAPWNPDQDIEDIFARGTFCRSLATKGEDPIMDATYTRALVTIFEESGVLEKACEDWNKKPKS